jgi:hypothetical protein
MQSRGALAVDSIGVENRGTSSRDAGLAGTREQRQCGGLLHLRCRRAFEHPGQRLGKLAHTQSPRDRLREILGNVSQLRDDPFAHGDHLYLRKLESIRLDDVRLFDVRLTAPEQRGLVVVFGKLLRFAAHFVTLYFPRE